MVSEADLVVTATTADSPLIYDKWVKPGTLVSVIGSYQELDEILILNSDKLIVDQLEQNIHRGEFSKLIQKGTLKIEDIYAEIGDIISLKKEGRIDDQERIVFSPIGIVCLDVSIAGLLLEKIGE